MNTIMPVSVCKWFTSTLRQPWIISTTASQVHHSTLPPEPVIASKKSLKVELVGGKRHSWCTCGHSKKQPFCDGAAKAKAQGLMPLRFVPEKPQLCYLAASTPNNPPYCDGTHKQDFKSNLPLYNKLTLDLRAVIQRAALMDNSA